MKNIKKVFSLILICIFTCGLLAIMSGCSLLIPKADNKRVYGDFIYSYIGRADSPRTEKNGKYVVIRGLSEEGEEKDIIIVPEKIDGKKVVQVGFSTFGVSDSLWGKYSKIYLPKSIVSISSSYLSRDAKAFFLEKPNDRFLKYEYGPTVYVSYDIYVELKDKDLNHYLCPGNVTYVVDGKIYAFDDVSTYSYSYLIEPPEEPIKAGYQFAGWYKEQECINEWNFENDKVPVKNTEEFDEIGQNGYSGEPINIRNSFIYYYNEIRLYSKWEEK